MKSPESRCGTVGWIGLTAGIIAWDILAPETLSHAYDRYLDDPVKKVVAIGAVAITGLHLLNKIPEQVDPLVQGFKAIERIIK